jgi:hypothetical protein
VGASPTRARPPTCLGRSISLSFGLRWLLRHCVLVDLGLSDERAVELISRCKRLSDELDLARRWIRLG